jgi:hypothetical protein
MKAQYAARRHAPTQEHLDRMLRQFSRERRAAILDRLRPHLNFEPRPLDLLRPAIEPRPR